MKKQAPGHFIIYDVFDRFWVQAFDTFKFVFLPAKLHILV